MNFIKFLYKIFNLSFFLLFIFTIFHIWSDNKQFALKIILTDLVILIGTGITFVIIKEGD